MTTAAKKTLSFGVLCPHCHSEDDTVVIDLNNLGECRCTGCDETFTPREACDLFVAAAEKWERVARWVEAAEIQ
jgi:hypothetical protein